MNSEVKIIVDTNYIFNWSTKRLINFIESMNKIGDVYIPETVLDEITEKDTNYIREVYGKIEKNNILSEGIKIKNWSDQLKKSIKNQYAELFDNKIIKISKVDIEKIYQRALLRKPPFVGDKSSSDKGFKDTLIWLSILEADYINYDEVLFLTNDNGFVQNKNQLEKEFTKKHEVSFDILREFNVDKNNENIKSTTTKSDEKIKLSNVNSDEITKDRKQLIEDYKQIEIYRDNLNIIMNNIVMDENYPFSEYYDSVKFRILEKINLLSIEELLENLHNVIEENITNRYITPIDFLQVFNSNDLFSVTENIESSYIVDLYELLDKFYLELGKYSISIIKTIVDYINQYTYISDSGNDSSLEPGELPF